jgi:tetratricopeptide (TPR) repeat protein
MLRYSSLITNELKNLFCSLMMAVIIVAGCAERKSNDHEHQQASSFDTSLLSAIDTSLLLSVADSHFKDNNFQEAIEEYSVLIDLDSTNGKFYYRMGYSLCQVFRYPEAIPYYVRAADLDYRTADSYFSLGLTYFILKDDSLATEYFEKCVEINPESEQALKLLDAVRNRTPITDVHI